MKKNITISDGKTQIDTYVRGGSRLEKLLYVIDRWIVFTPDQKKELKKYAKSKKK